MNIVNAKIISSALLVFCLTACNGNNDNQTQTQTNDASVTLNASSAKSAISISDNHFKKENLARRKAIEIYDISNKLRAYEITAYDLNGKSIGFLNVPVAKGFGTFTSGGEGSRSEKIEDTYQKEWKPLLEENGIKILSSKMVGTEFGFLGMAVKTDKALTEASTDAVKNYFSDFSRTAYKIDEYYILSFFPETKTDFGSLK